MLHTDMTKIMSTQKLKRKNFWPDWIIRWKSMAIFHAWLLTSAWLLRACSIPSLSRNVWEKRELVICSSVNKKLEGGIFLVCHPVVGYKYKGSIHARAPRICRESDSMEYLLFSWQCLPEKMIMMMRFQKATWLSKGLQTISWTTGGKQRPDYYMYAK